MSYLALYTYAWVSIGASLLFTTLSSESIFPEHMTNIIVLGLFPVFFAILRYIQTTQEDESHHDEYRFTYTIVGSILSLLLIAFAPADTLTLISLIVMVYIVFSTFDARILFAIALVDIIAVPLLLMMQQQSYAEYFSVQAYYALVLGTLALLIGEWGRRTIHHYIPPFTPPRSWDDYIREMYALLDIARRYLPIILLVLLILGHSPWSGTIQYDERFIMTLSFVMAISTLIPHQTHTIWTKRDILVAVLAGIAAVFTFSGTSYIEGLIAAILYGGALYLLIHERHRLQQYRYFITRYLTHD